MKYQNQGPLPLSAPDLEALPSWILSILAELPAIVSAIWKAASIARNVPPDGWQPTYVASVQK